MRAWRPSGRGEEGRKEWPDDSGQGSKLTSLAWGHPAHAPNLTFRSGTPGAPPWHSPGKGYPHQ